MPIPAEVRVFALVPAGGSGTRMGAPLPKQYLSLHGMTLAEHTLARLLACARIERIVVAVGEDDHWWSALPVASHRRVSTAAGGALRAQSVLNGLQALGQWASDSDWVLVHDMARPCLRVSDIHKLLAACTDEGAILALPVADTVKQSPETGDAVISATLPRAQIWRALTPQLFPIGALRSALEKALANAAKDAGEITDEASAMEALGWRPALVVGQADNIKVTWPADLALAGFYLRQQQRDPGSAA
ncbi:2-C-methyl-D-erythritol 4-phosphate cytidylyltransferase [Alcanivorax sp. JB21]|uniref:2-C-methyl-D-erythritol 4-phosphate cytidylyltransferase n=1 Tax=Alcanivorax limicola TaxID=2874102 RepID=UPI001CBAF98C|nr:2-C-methyl-D-erythritol 4-phosphate cytidylyltransferase [Alcanivorax limicola]MBZ2188382.1 2-C-methyl-D-erythritol 4-phosphate cytidylyltransferase [Alcanivorax limicola]